MATTRFSSVLSSIAERGLSIMGLSGSGRKQADAAGIIELCHMLLSSKGEASGIGLSFEILSQYRQLDEDEKTKFFHALGQDFSPDRDAVESTAKAYIELPSPRNLAALASATVPVRQELLMRLNQAPDATRHLVNMRADLLARIKHDRELELVDREFVQLFTSWFNRGFLELRNIDWHTSASILEKIIRYEAVHGMSGWEELRGRIDPEDRLIYGFFHPRLGDEPLIFVEVALMEQMPGSITDVLASNQETAVEAANTAIFYSISNCQKGLLGIPLGNFLIKQVVEDLQRNYPRLKEFATLSPVPGFARWLQQARAGNGDTLLPEDTIAAIEAVGNGEWWTDEKLSRSLEKQLVPAIAWYLCEEKDSEGRPIDPVARFHLGNGAKLERINWAGDISTGALNASLGIMVNYRYQLDEIERNHEQFANSRTVVASASVMQSAKAFRNLIKKADVARKRSEAESAEETVEDLTV
ncbi:MAG: malonyl-CoA decarboxylase [Pseudomonadota bacterium]